LNTLSQGFGAAAGNASIKSRGDTIIKQNTIESSVGEGTRELAMNYYEVRATELQEELEELHNLINENHGHDSILASYIEQVKKKDKLLLERDKKLDQLQKKNNLAEKDRETLKE